jgi:aspartyl protease family protein
MPISTNPEWQQLAIYALGAGLVLFLVFRIPYVGRILRALFSLALITFAIFLLFQQLPYDPNLSRIAGFLGLDQQEVTGREVRIQMAPDGHFWARARINGVERRMLVDSGATITALSAQTARLASVEAGESLMPVILRTANGSVSAETGTVERLGLGGIEARNLKVVISPSLGEVDILGMNFLSRLQSWRVEGRTLILVPQGAGGAGETRS